MLDSKTLLAAASLAVLAAAGLGSAAAQPWDRHDTRIERHIDRHEDRMDRRFDRRDHRAFVGRMRLSEALRFHHYRVVGDPYFVRDRYVVRVHDRRGRTVFVQVDPYNGAFIREVRL